MKKIFALFGSIRQYLTYQIFAYFGLVFVIMLAIAFILPKLDARAFSHLETDEKAFYQQESQTLLNKYNMDEVFERKLALDSPNGLNLIVFDPKTSIFIGASPKQVKPLQVFIYRAHSPEQPLRRMFDNIEIYGPFSVKSAQREYYHYFVKTVDPQQELFNIFFDSPWLMLFILLAVSIPILFWLSYKIAQPVHALRLSANAVASGNLAINPELENGSIYEIREVGRSFNQMIQSLQQLRLHQQRLLSDISHELKTPLARMQLATAILRHRSGESNELTRIENEIQKLNAMVLDLLSLSRQELNQHLTREIFPIEQIWQTVLDDANFETEQNGIMLLIRNRIFSSKPNLINGNANILASAVENVIRNAQKYANQRISVMLYLDKQTLVIAIEDDGEGVPEHEYEQIFRPFYRVDEARARQTGGTGLGLAIVQNAIQQHNGTVAASKSQLGGLKVEIRLPLWIE
ncbi:two-component system sensor histidine kinase CpxA [Haemophilus paracuniculus]|uniref:histidine kinase n=1 Tax=Haemophilus paracuniculus TaxID=734 RepID=A0A1T0ASA4_9PAST|nr:envelope stress sensor histidine kinase CpxA [Haemophilus paracuniculus]OOR99267.1 two-component system sensor histidine kinase CpxA [Haemophilus paracuniculus]